MLYLLVSVIMWYCRAGSKPLIVLLMIKLQICSKDDCWSEPYWKVPVLTHFFHTVVLA